MAEPAFDGAAVSALLLRNLSSDETTFATALWHRVWRRIIARRPAFEATPPALTADVISSVVARVIQNPAGFRSETDGNYSYSLMGGDPRALEPTSLQWQDLIGRGGAFSIDPLSATAGAGLPWWDVSAASGDVVVETS